MIKLLTQRDLAFRWSLSPRTLERWRWAGTGPTYLKIGGRARYRIEDIEEYERLQKFCGADGGIAVAEG
jgi:predicted site-specific integrase-resolvase